MIATTSSGDANKLSFLCGVAVHCVQATVHLCDGFGHTLSQGGGGDGHKNTRTLMHRQAHRHTLDQWDKRATVEIAKPADPATSQHKHIERKEGLFASSLLSFLHKQRVRITLHKQRVRITSQSHAFTTATRQPYQTHLGTQHDMLGATKTQPATSKAGASHLPLRPA
jgi:hypothetical protein